MNNLTTPKCPKCEGNEYEMWSNGYRRCTTEIPSGGECGEVYRLPSPPDPAGDGAGEAKTDGLLYWMRRDCVSARPEDLPSIIESLNGRLMDATGDYQHLQGISAQLKQQLSAAQQALAAEQAGAAAMREAICTCPTWTPIREYIRLLRVNPDGKSYAWAEAVGAPLEAALSDFAGAAMLERVRKAEEACKVALDALLTSEDGQIQAKACEMLAAVINPTPNAESETP